MPGPETGPETRPLRVPHHRPSRARTRRPAAAARAAGVLVLVLVAVLAAASDRLGSPGGPAPGEATATLFASDEQPASARVADEGRGVELGVGFTPAVDGGLTGLRFYRVAGDTAAHSGSLWSATGERLGAATFPADDGVGWSTASFADPVPLSAGVQYVASYHTDGPYVADHGWFDAAPDPSGPLSFAAPTGTTPGLYSYGDTPVAPGSAYRSTNYWVDVQFVPSGSSPDILAHPSPSASPAPQPAPEPVPPSEVGGAPGGMQTTATETGAGAPGTGGGSGSGGGAGSGSGGSGGWPGPGTTGVPAGVVLSRTGAMTVTTPGAVVDGKQIDGDLTIRADGVVVRNTLVNGRIDTGDAGTYSGIVIQDTEIAGGGDDGIGVGYTGFTCLRCDVHGFGKGFGLVRDVVVQDSWVHDLVVNGDPANGGSHNEAILSIGGSGFTIVGNRLDAGGESNFSASLALYSQAELIRDVLVQGNLFNGGGYCVYAGSTGGRQAVNVRFLQNTFGSAVSATCGWYGPATGYSPGSGNIWSGNVTSAGVAVGVPPE